MLGIIWPVVRSFGKNQFKCLTMEANFMFLKIMRSELRKLIIKILQNPKTNTGSLYQNTDFLRKSLFVSRKAVLSKEINNFKENFMFLSFLYVLIYSI